MKVLNIGSLNIDRTYEVAEFVQPGETVKALSFKEYPGGKGLNQSVALARAGAEVWHVGAVGPDGESLIEMLSEAGVRCCHISRVPCPSGHAVIQVNNKGQNSILVSAGANGLLNPESIAKALDAMEPADIVLIQNETALCDYSINEAHKRGLKIALNPSPMSECVKTFDLSAVDLLILNEHEASAISGCSLANDTKILAQRLSSRFPEASVMLTCASRGSVFIHGGKLLEQPAFPVDAVDTTGAGDTFCGYFIASALHGLPIKQALVRASAASALSVTTRGTARSIPSASQVDEFIATRVDAADYASGKRLCRQRGVRAAKEGNEPREHRKERQKWNMYF